MRINGGFLVLKREILDLIEPGDELVEETFERLIAERELIAYPYDGFFRAMDTIKDRQSLESLNESGEAPWRRFPAGGGRGAPTAVLSLSPAEPLRRVLAIGCHADDIEIGCGGTLLTLAAGEPGRSRSTGWCSRRRASGRDEARASAEAFLAGVAAAPRRGARVPRRLPPVRRRRGEGRLRGAEGPRRPELVLTHARLRPASGPPARVRADLEHVPQPPDPRVRDPEGRRRPRPAERLRPALERASSRRSSTLLERHFPSQAGKHWFDRETFLGLMRLRGMEAVAPARFAEGFTAPQAGARRVKRRASATRCANRCVRFASAGAPAAPASPTDCHARLRSRHPRRHSRLGAPRLAPLGSRIAVFGGVYNNYLALAAALDDAAPPRLPRRSTASATSAASGRIPTASSRCCASAASSCIQGNYDDSIGHGLADCGCGYTDPRDNHFAAALATTTPSRSTSPPMAARGCGDAAAGAARDARAGTRVLMCHGSPRQINEFLWESTVADAVPRAACCDEHERRRHPRARTPASSGTGGSPTAGTSSTSASIGRPANDGRTQRLVRAADAPAATSTSSSCRSPTTRSGWRREMRASGCPRSSSRPS